ncbi:UNVERIFIED_CONTAM: 26S proteasome regulatory subunitB [Sesamum latifolium]|uniref:26S proteasome regulatory subunitB n=1 Tax=Sesamum latifolium TaxID=2727402 RepID=A0AAW2VXR4_9LAMI
MKERRWSGRRMAGNVRRSSGGGSSNKRIRHVQDVGETANLLQVKENSPVELGSSAKCAGSSNIQNGTHGLINEKHAAKSGSPGDSVISSDVQSHNQATWYSNGPEEYSQLLNKYYELEGQRLQILQQLNQYSTWNYQQPIPSASTSEVYQASDPQLFDTVTCYFPYGCQNWNSMSPQDSDYVKMAMVAAEKALSSLKEANGVKDWNGDGYWTMQYSKSREAVELPLIHQELFQQIGIDPPRPRGVLLHGPPWNCLFIFVGHRLFISLKKTMDWNRFYCCHCIQITNGTIGPKCLQGPRMVRDVFWLVKEKAPAIIFIDEVDAIATAGFDARTHADQDCQRILMELFNQDIGGCDIQKQEIREDVELPLTHHELYQQIGIDPPRPRGVLLHGPPGTGKTMLAKAVAKHTTCILHHSCWLRIYSEVLGREKEPAVIFIDEVHAIATAGFDAQIGAGQEIVYVKVVMATNRADTVDPALLRPGRLDRKIEFPLRDRRQKRARVSGESRRSCTI